MLRKCKSSESLIPQIDGNLSFSSKNSDLDLDESNIFDWGHERRSFVNCQSPNQHLQDVKSIPVLIGYREDTDVTFIRGVQNVKNFKFQVPKELSWF